MVKDYIAAYVPSSDDIRHFGVRGMKWGVRRNRSAGGKATPTRARKKEDKANADTKQHAALMARAEKIKAGTGRPLIVNGKLLSRAESVSHLQKQAAKLGVKPKTAEVKPADKKPAEPSLPTKSFNELKAQVKEKGANSLSDDELKYLNARTEALGKAQKAYGDQGSWLAKTVKSSLKNAAEQQIRKQTNSAAENLLQNFIKAQTSRTKGSSSSNPKVRIFRPGSSGKSKTKTSPSSLGSSPVYKVTTL